MLKIGASKRPKTICDCHQEIMNLAKEIIGIKTSEYDDVVQLLIYVQRLADNIYSEAEDAYEYGNNMEGRLHEYFSAIEDLGFKRERKQK
jgi:hypothetical protein